MPIQYSGIVEVASPVLNTHKWVHLPLVPTSPHHEEVRRGFRGPCVGIFTGSRNILPDAVWPAAAKRQPRARSARRSSEAATQGKEYLKIIEIDDHFFE